MGLSSRHPAPRVAGSLTSAGSARLVLLESMKSDPPPDSSSSSPDEPSGVVTPNLNLAALASTIEEVSTPPVQASAGSGTKRRLLFWLFGALVSPWPWLPSLDKPISRLAEGQLIR